VRRVEILQRWVEVEEFLQGVQVKVFFLRTWSRKENLRKDRPSIFSKDRAVKFYLEGLQEVSQVMRKWTGSAEEHLVIQGIKKGRTNGQNPSGRSCKISRAVRFGGGTGRLRREHLKF
jgi:hypothetical protein